MADQDAMKLAADVIAEPWRYEPKILVLARALSASSRAAQPPADAEVARVLEVITDCAETLRVDGLPLSADRLREAARTVQAWGPQVARVRELEHILFSSDPAPWQEAMRARVKVLEEALQLCGEALKRHGRWCGYKADAPGDGIINDAKRAYDAALATAATPAAEPEQKCLHQLERVDAWRCSKCGEVVTATGQSERPAEPAADGAAREPFDFEIELELSLETVQGMCRVEEPETFKDKLIADWLTMHREISIRDAAPSSPGGATGEESASTTGKILDDPRDS